MTTTHTAPSTSTIHNADAEAVAPPELIRCETTADFLAALPRLVGFTATNSLFIVFFNGKRSSASLRVDLPARRDQGSVTRYLDELCDLINDHKSAHGESAPVAVISSAEAFAESVARTGSAPWQYFATRLERRLAREGSPARELCLIAPDGWMSYHDPAAPRLGRPLSELAESSAAGKENIPTLRDLGGFPDASGPEIAQVSVAFAEFSDTDPVGPDLEYAVTQVFTVTDATPLAAARTIHTLSKRAGWTQVVEELAISAEGALAGEASRRSLGPTPATEEQVTVWRAAMARLRTASIQLTKLVPLAPPATKPALISLSALAWRFRGLQSVAQRQITEALQLDEYSAFAMAARALIDSGQLPLKPAES